MQESDPKQKGRIIKWPRNVFVDEGFQSNTLELGDGIGKGGFGEVFRVKCWNGNKHRELALKIVGKKKLRDKNMLGRVRQEILIHSKLDHPSILKFYDSCEDEQNFYILLELCCNGCLKNYLESTSLSEDEVRIFIDQIIDGLIYLHSQKVIHRDLSLSNLLLTDSFKVKIADFGLATKVECPDDVHSTICGTPNFISPEMVKNLHHGFATDIWSLGCILYYLLVGKPPFNSSSTKETFHQIHNAKYSIPKNLSPNAQDLIRKLLVKNPKSRLKFKDVKKHPFMMPKFTEKIYLSASGDSRNIYNLSMDSGVDTLPSSVSSKHGPMKAFPINSQPHLLESLNEENVMNQVHGEILSESDNYSSGVSVNKSSHSNSLRRHLKQKQKKWITDIPLKSVNSECLQKHVEFTAGQHSSDGICKKTTEIKQSGQYYLIDGESDNHPTSGLMCSQFSSLHSSNSKRKALSDCDERGKTKNVDLLSKCHDCEKKIQCCCLEDGNEHKSWCLVPHKDLLSSPIYNITCSHHYVCMSCSHDNMCACKNRTHQETCFLKFEDSEIVLKDKNETSSCQNCSSKNVRSPSPSLRFSEEKLPKHFQRLNTARLKPIKQVMKQFVLSITESSQVVLAFIRKNRQTQMIYNIWTISPDGEEIQVFSLNNGRGIPLEDYDSNFAGLKPNRVFHFDDLPDKYKKIYAGAYQFVELVKMKTPKISYYSKRAKCFLMENSPLPDFEANFYNRWKISLSSNELKITDDRSQTQTVKKFDRDKWPPLSADDLHSSVIDLCNHFLECHQVCTKLDEMLTKFEEETKVAGFFPVIIGCRPSNTSSKSPSSPNNENYSRMVDMTNDLKMSDINLSSMSSANYCKGQYRMLTSKLPDNENGNLKIHMKSDEVQGKQSETNIAAFEQFPNNDWKISYEDGLEIKWISQNMVEVVDPNGIINKYDMKSVPPELLSRIRNGANMIKLKCRSTERKYLPR